MFALSRLSSSLSSAGKSLLAGRGAVGQVARTATAAASVAYSCFSGKGFIQGAAAIFGYMTPTVRGSHVIIRALVLNAATLSFSLYLNHIIQQLPEEERRKKSGELLEIGRDFAASVPIGHLIRVAPELAAIFGGAAIALSDDYPIEQVKIKEIVFNTLVTTVPLSLLPAFPAAAVGMGLAGLYHGLSQHSFSELSSMFYNELGKLERNMYP